MDKKMKLKGQEVKELKGRLDAGYCMLDFIAQIFYRLLISDD